MQSSPILDQQRQADIDFVVREFSNHARRDEIKQSMMARRGLSWNEAEEFVGFVERTYGRNIALRQMPLLLFLAFGSLLVGCALLIYAVWRLRSGIPLTPRAARRLVGTLATGVVLIVGGIVGLIQTFAALRR